MLCFGAAGDVFEAEVAEGEGLKEVVFKQFKAETSPDGHCRDESAITAALDHPHLTRVLALVDNPKGLLLQRVYARQGRNAAPTLARPRSEVGRPSLLCKGPSSHGSCHLLGKGAAPFVVYLTPSSCCQATVSAGLMPGCSLRGPPAAASLPCRAMAEKPNFDSLLRCRWAVGHSFSLEFVLRVAQGVASALEYLHAHGICHGDVYAHNIMTAPEGYAVLCDFGQNRCLAFLPWPGAGARG